MDSSMIGKIEKAILYAQEPERIQFNSFELIFAGDHTEHVVTYDDGSWSCNCHFFENYGICSHIMALERVLAGSVKTADAPAIAESIMIGKIEKSILYANERDRLRFKQLDAQMNGDHKPHQVTYKDGEWSCDCSFFNHRGICSHVMTIERLLENAVETAQAIPMPA
jgi:hypothetical protein